jgi:hypothetical protein
MSKPSVFRPAALRRRALRAEPPAPAPPVPSARSVRLLWALLALAVAGLVATAKLVHHAIDGAQIGAREAAR